MSKRVDSPIFGLPQQGQSLGVAFWCFRFPTTSRKFRSIPILGCWLLVFAVVVFLLDFYVVFWVSHLVCQVVSYAFSVVALEYDLVVFGCSSAGAECFHFLG